MDNQIKSIVNYYMPAIIRHYPLNGDYSNEWKYFNELVSMCNELLRIEYPMVLTGLTTHEMTIEWEDKKYTLVLSLLYENGRYINVKWPYLRLPE